jgi:U3 small nucleolar ribonucleoprotein protein IMP4
VEITYLFVDQPIPTEIRKEAHELKHNIDLDLKDIDETAAIDDEYANIGNREPKICVSTSRDPSSRLKQFAK